jgi:dienelactone hydrolase
MDPPSQNANKQGEPVTRLHAVILSSLALTVAGAAADAAEAVSFPGNGVRLDAIVYRPAGSGPFPAIVALHGCSGLYGKDGSLSPRHVDWAERLAAQGFLALFPDSFGSRGAESQCKTDDRVTRPSRERVDDALAAKTYLQSRHDVKPNAVSLLGWSNGGSTVLYAVQKGREAKDGQPDFATAIAFYPGCRTPAEHGGWHARVPLMILIGAADDWTPAQPCEALAADASAAGEPVSIVVYPGAYHDFDHPNLTVRSHSDLAYTADGGGRAHTGTNPAARQDALRRVPAFLVR